MARDSKPMVTVALAVGGLGQQLPVKCSSSIYILETDVPDVFFFVAVICHQSSEE